MIKEQTIYLRQFFFTHFEWVAFTLALLVIGLMDPYIENGSSLCLFDLMNVPYCPGDGLGHSIAYTFRGDINNALEANVLGPVSIIILVSRIMYLINNKIVKTNLCSG